MPLLFLWKSDLKKRPKNVINISSQGKNTKANFHFIPLLFSVFSRAVSVLLALNICELHLFMYNANKFSDIYNSIVKQWVLFIKAHTRTRTTINNTAEAVEKCSPNTFFLYSDFKGLVSVNLTFLPTVCVTISHMYQTVLQYT